MRLRLLGLGVAATIAGCNSADVLVPADGSGPFQPNRLPPGTVGETFHSAGLGSSPAALGRSPVLAPTPPQAASTVQPGAPAWQQRAAQAGWRPPQAPLATPVPDPIDPLAPIAMPPPVVPPPLDADAPFASSAPPQAPVQQVFVAPPSIPTLTRPVEPPPRKRARPALSKAELQCRSELKRLKVAFKPVEPVRGKMGCGIAHPIKVTKLSRRIAVKPSATMNCQAALAAAKWAHRELAPAARLRYASNVASIRHMSAYSCRRIRGTGTLSEHGKGNALDIGAIELKNGRMIKVAKKGFFSMREKSFLKAIRKGACDHFSTVLGPGYNRDHADHLHFDLKQRRGGRRFCDL